MNMDKDKLDPLAAAKSMSMFQLAWHVGYLAATVKDYDNHMTFLQQQLAELMTVVNDVPTSIAPPSTLARKAFIAEAGDKSEAF